MEDEMAQTKTTSLPQSETSNELTARVADLEREVASLKSSLASMVREANRKMLGTVGSMPDDEVSREAERLGREWRERQPKC
jgi:cell division protein FtsB